MRITAIEINNFRQYQNLAIQFAKTTEYDLHIIVADNGVGKTNILNAVTWCLYDEEPHLGDKSKSLPRLNLKAKAEAMHKGLSDVVVSVKLFAEDADDKIMFYRKINAKANTVEAFESRSELTVTLNSTGDAKIVVGEEADSFIDRYMPKKIKQYFCFDGEQLDSYFISDESSKIKETIHAISQVDVVSRVKDRLSKVIYGKQSEAGKIAPDINLLNNTLLSINNEIVGITENTSNIEKQISISETIIKTNTEHLSGQENLPELEAKFQRLLTQKADLGKRERSCFSEIFAFVREMKIALSLYPSAKATLNVILEKEAQNALPPNIDKKLLREILTNKEGLCLICDQSLTDHSKKHIEELIDKIQVSSAASNILMYIRGELERIISTAEYYPKSKKLMLDKLKGIQSDLEQCEVNLQATDNDISRFQDKQQVIQWHNERKTHQQLLETNKGKKLATEYQLADAVKRQKESEEKLKKALQKEQECARLNQLILFATSAKSVVEKIEIEMMSEVRAKMEIRTLKYFSDLIWKKGIYDHITLDDKYQLDLIHRDGYSCVGSCSAAERSLLALSFTLALHEVSGFNALLFIDTPVARVAGQNRVNFANVLQQVSRGKQLIMAFTPDEYSESIKNVFKPIASTYTHLVMNADSDISNVE